MPAEKTLRTTVRLTPGSGVTRRKFLVRIRRGNVSRDESSTSHICVYFAAYDPRTGHVFIGHHRKSGLWLFNGGHIDRGERPMEAVRREMGEEWGFRISLPRGTRPQLLTLTRIAKNPAKRACRWHYDIWYFVPVRRTTFTPKPHLLATEYFVTGWRTIGQARMLTKDPSTRLALQHLKTLFTS